MKAIASLYRPVVLAVLYASFGNLLGCSNLTEALSVSAAGESATAPTGTVSTGQFPISGASVTLYAVGRGQDGALASVLAGPVLSGNDGSFSLPASFQCPASDPLVYLVATGGDPSLSPAASNASAALMAAPGNCSALAAGPVRLDEIATVSAVWSLAPFMNSLSALGSTVDHAPQLKAAYAQILQLAKATQGQQTSARGVQATINTLANMLAACVHSTGVTVSGTGQCDKLFATAAHLGGVPVNNTVDAALEIAKHSSSSNTADVFILSVANTSYLPVLTQAPAAWSLSNVATSSSVPVTPSTLRSPEEVSASGAPAASSFDVPAENACQSAYDRFYENEPGVYAYWALCEGGSPAEPYDYVGSWDLTKAAGAFGTRKVIGGDPGPVPDGETASYVSSALDTVEAQGIPLNVHEGSVAGWISGAAKAYPLTAAYFAAVGGHSNIAISLVTVQQQLCLRGTLTNSAGTQTLVQNCGYTPNTWHRVVLTWLNGSLSLYVDGALSASSRYEAAIDDAVFYYRLFPGCCNVDVHMALAKVAVANRAWPAAQVAADAAHDLPPVPNGGAFVSASPLGTIHRKILGYGDNNQDISTSSTVAAVKEGLAKGGFTSVRYAGGYGGITADLSDWRTGATCSGRGIVGRPGNLRSKNNLDTYVPQVAKPLGLDVVYTVNYGTNPPYCDGGGDPNANGADLVRYANVTHSYGIKHWEIGNEVYSQSTEADYHPHPNTGVSYATYEPAFYSAMKAVDSTIQIAVPVSLSNYAWATGFSLPVLRDARYDAVAFHHYMVKDPITDGATLYSDRVAANVSRTRGELLTLKTALLSHGKAEDAIWVTEWNGEVFGDKWSKQTVGAVSPLFAAMQLGEYLQAGVQLATWWAQGGATVCSTLNFDPTANGAYSWWNCGSTAVTYVGSQVGRGEVQVGLGAADLTPVGRTFQLLAASGFVIEGEHMLRTYVDQSNAPWLVGYSATHKGSRALILINRDQSAAHVVPVQLEGQTSGSSVEQWTYGRAQYDATRLGDWSQAPVEQTLGSWSDTFQAKLPPWSVSVFIFH